MSTLSNLSNLPTLREPAEALIRRATVRDADEILALQKLAFRVEAERYADPNIPPMAETVGEVIAQFETHVFLKAVLPGDGRIVGSVRAHREDGNGTVAVGRLIVHPDWQGHGIGTRLVRAIEASYAGARRFELYTGHRSEGSLRLYRRLGYHDCRIQKINEALTFVYLEKAGPADPAVRP